MYKREHITMTDWRAGMSHRSDSRLNGRLADYDTEVFTSIHYLNYTGKDIYVQDRMGVVVRVPNRLPAYPDRDRYKIGKIELFNGNFYILYQMAVMPQDIPEMVKQYESMTGISPLLAKAHKSLVDTYKDLDGRIHFNGPGQVASESVHKTIDYASNVTISLISGVHLSNLESDAYYAKDIGVTLATREHRDRIETVCDMNDLQLTRSNMVNLDSIHNSDPASFHIQAIVPEGRKIYNQLYVKIAGKIHKVPIKESRHTDFEGIEIRRKRDVDQEEGIVTVERLTFKEAQDLYGVYDNIHEADTVDERLEKEHKRKIDEIKRDLELKESENKRLKIEFDRFKIETEEVATIRKENHEREIEQYKVEHQKDARYIAEMEHKNKIMDQEYKQMEQDLKRETMAHAKWKHEAERLAAREKAAMEYRANQQKAGIDSMRNTYSIIREVLGFTFSVFKIIKA